MKNTIDSDITAFVNSLTPEQYETLFVMAHGECPVKVSPEIAAMSDDELLTALGLE